MTELEILELNSIFRRKYASLERTPKEFWEKGSREHAWDELMERMGITRISKLAPKPDAGVRIEEPNTGRYMIIPKETARKILVLGLP